MGRCARQCTYDHQRDPVKDQPDRRCRALDEAVPQPDEPQHQGWQRSDEHEPRDGVVPGQRMLRAVDLPEEENRDIEGVRAIEISVEMVEEPIDRVPP